MIEIFKEIPLLSSIATICLIYFLYKIAKEVFEVLINQSNISNIANDLEKINVNKYLDDENKMKENLAKHLQYWNIRKKYVDKSTKLNMNQNSYVKLKNLFKLR